MGRIGCAIYQTNPIWFPQFFLWYETIETHALTFLSHIILASAGVIEYGLILFLVSLPGPEVVAAFESETDVTTADLLLFKADAKTEVVESFERSKPWKKKFNTFS